MPSDATRSNSPALRTIVCYAMRAIRARRTYYLTTTSHIIAAAAYCVVASIYVLRERRTCGAIQLYGSTLQTFAAEWRSVKTRIETAGGMTKPTVSADVRLAWPNSGRWSLCKWKWVGGTIIAGRTLAANTERWKQSLSAFILMCTFNCCLVPCHHIPTYSSRTSNRTYLQGFGKCCQYDVINIRRTVPTH